MRLGKIIEKIRLDHGLTQTEFANKIGISQPHLWRIEHLKSLPSISILKTIARKFKIDYEHLRDVYEQELMEYEKEKIIKRAKVFDMNSKDFKTSQSKKRPIPVFSAPADFPKHFYDEFDPSLADEWFELRINNYSKVAGIKVQGNCMAPELKEGDKVFFVSIEEAGFVSGDIVLVEFENGEREIRRIRDRGEYYSLEAENPAYSPIFVKKDEEGKTFRILAKKIIMIRE